MVGSGRARRISLIRQLCYKIIKITLVFDGNMCIKMH